MTDQDPGTQETELLGAYSELEERVAARTAELLDLNQHLEHKAAECQRRADENAYLHRQLQEHVADLEREVSEHARTEAYLQERNRELALFSRSIHALSSALDTEHVLESIIDQVHRLLDVVACSVWFLDPQAKELVCQQATGYGDETVLGWRLPVETGIVGAAARTARTINVPVGHCRSTTGTGQDHWGLRGRG
jgi:nitrate/nitrite-specific signal transduction histidine kinase